MSFHQSGTPQSLQADYWIASHFSAFAVEAQDQRPIGAVLDTPWDTIRGTRPAGVMVVSEHTPLLKHSFPVPRLHESPNDNVCDAALDQIPTSTMFCEELGTLALSAVPVFGCVIFLYCHLRTYPVSVPKFSDTHSFLFPSSPSVTFLHWLWRPPL